MHRLHFIFVAVFCILFLLCSANFPFDDKDKEWYYPAFEGVPNVPVKFSLEEYKKELKKEYNWIDPQIRDKILHDATAEKFRSCFIDICGEIPEIPTLTQVKEIIREILDPSASPTYLNTLPKKCSADITATVPFLIDNPYYRVLTGFQNWKGNDAYLEAVMSNDKDRLHYLSKLTNFNYERPNTYGITAILAASRRCSYYEVKRILKSKISFERQDKFGRTALHLVAQYCSSVRLPDILIRKGKFDINSQDDQGNTPLHLAYYQVLYGDHQSISTVDEASSTAGSYNSNPADSVLDYLVRVPEIDPNIRNFQGDTVLHIACRELDSILIEQLLRRDLIDLSVKDNRGQTALDIIYSLGRRAIAARDVSRFVACLAAFIKFGVFVDPSEQIGPFGNTILHLMCQEHQFYALRILLKMPVESVNQKNDLGLTPLEIAFEKDGNVLGPLTLAFLENVRTDVSIKLNSDGDTILHIACRNRDLATVKSVMKYPRAPINQRNNNGQVPLHIAYEQSDTLVSSIIGETHKPSVSAINLLIIEELLQHPLIDPNFTLDNDALIHMACRRNDYDTVERLLRRKRTNVNLLGRDEKTPIRIAFDNEGFRFINNKNTNPKSLEGADKSIMKLLLQRHGIALDCVFLETRDTLLHKACDSSNIAAVRLLLENLSMDDKVMSIDVNSINRSSQTALWIAYEREKELSRGQFEIGPMTRMLLECKHIDASVPINSSGDTLLHVACRHNNVAAIRYLLSLGEKINVNACNDMKATPFQIAYALDQISEQARLLAPEPVLGPSTLALLEDPRVNCDVAVDGHGNTILHVLTEFKPRDTLRQLTIFRLVENILFKHGADPDIPNYRGQKPLHNVYNNEGFSLIQQPDKGLLPLLLSCPKVDPNIPMGNHQGTLLHLACLQLNVEAAKVLLSCPNVDIMVQDGQGSTAFELALEVKTRRANSNDALLIAEIFEVGKRRLNQDGEAELSKALRDDALSEQLKRKSSVLFRLRRS